MLTSVERAIQWLNNCNDDSTLELEAEHIVERELIRQQLVEHPFFGEELKNRYISNTIGECIPNKYGGNVGSVISTAKAAGLFINDDRGHVYLKWVLRQQNTEGFWIEAITGSLPANKSWYFNSTRKYWVTASVIQCIFGYNSEICNKGIRKGMDAILFLARDIIEQTNNHDMHYITSYLQFCGIDLWTLAHIIRTILVADIPNEDMGIALLSVLKKLYNVVLISNVDIIQNICGVLFDFFPSERNFCNELYERIIGLQHSSGSWGYDSCIPDITLTAYIIELLLKMGRE